MGLVSACAIAFGFVVLLLQTGEMTGNEEQVAWLVTGYFALTLTLLCLSYFQLPKQNVGFFVLMCAHMFWFALPAMLVLDENRYWGDLAHYKLPDYVVTKTALILLLFLGINLIAYAVSRRRAVRHSSAQRGSLDQTREFYPRLRWILGGLFVVGLVPFFVFGNDLGDIVEQIMASRTTVKPWTMAAHQINPHGPIVVISRAALVTFSAMAIWLVVARRQLGLKTSDTVVLLAGFFVGLIVTYFDSGTRTWTVLIIGPVLITNLFSRLSERRLLGGALVSAVLAIMAIGLVQAQRYYRFTATMEGITPEDVFQLDDTDFFTETAIAVDLVPARFDYVEQFEPWLFVTNPIPRFLWHDKPFSHTVWRFSLGRSGYDEYMQRGVSRLPSIVGQHYMSWGMLGVLVAAVLWGWGFALFDRFYQTSSAHSVHAFFAAMGMVWLFTCSRGVYPGFHYPVVFVGLLLLYMTWRAKKLQRFAAEIPVLPSKVRS